MTIHASELQEVIDDWSYHCPKKSCGNRTFTIITETKDPLLVSSSPEGLRKYLTVRVLRCDNCKFPTVLGTHSYNDSKLGWAARGQVLTKNELKMLAAVTIPSGGQLPYKPKEFLAFLEPIQERTLPAKIPKKIVESFREAEYAVVKNKPVSAAATLRNTIRLIVEDHGIVQEHLSDAIKELPFAKEYIEALGKMKIMGDDSLHFEEYTISELQPAIEIMHLALQDYYEHKERLALLTKAVGDKASKKGKSNV